MYRSFDPDLAIMPARGQVFATDSVPRDELLRIDGVREVSYSLDGNALLEYRGHQFFGMIRGVDSLYAEVVPVDSMTVEGQYRLRFGDMPEAFVGRALPRRSACAPGSAVDHRLRTAPGTSVAAAAVQLYRSNRFSFGRVRARGRDRRRVRVRPARFRAAVVRLFRPGLDSGHPPRGRSFRRPGERSRRGMSGQRFPRADALRAERVVLPDHDLREMGHLFHHPAGASRRLVLADRLARHADHRQAQGHTHADDTGADVRC
ncbi:MAG: hypothetical protein ACLTTP_05770 [Alistipes ihumii]